MSIKPLCALDRAIVLNREEWDRLERHFEVRQVDFADQLYERLGSYELALVHSKLSPESIRGLHRCRYIGVRAHNTDYVDASIAAGMGIEVRGIPQAGEYAVAEHTFALLFAVAKQITAYHANVVEGSWRSGLAPNMELRGKSLGVVGYGKIGQLVADMARVFGMNVLVVARGEASEGRLPLEEVLRLSDIVTLHASTKGLSGPLIDRGRLAMMKKEAILINTARGKLLDYEALEEALRSGKLGGAGLDVFAEEPFVQTSLSRLHNVVCTPHLAYYTDITIANMNEYLIQAAEDFFGSSE